MSATEAISVAHSDARWRDLSRQRDFSDPPPRVEGFFCREKSLHGARARAAGGRRLRRPLSMRDSVRRSRAVREIKYLK